MAEKELKTIQQEMEIKDAEDKDIMHIRAYGSVFGNVDSYGDIVAKGAFDKFLKSQEAGRIKFCFQHRNVVGKITDMGVDEKGLWFEADVLNTTEGLDVQKLIRAKAINECSIGYFADQYHYEKTGKKEHRILDAVTVAEISVVARAANPKAVLLSAKGEDMQTGLRALSGEDFDSLYKAVKEEYARRVFASM